MVEYWVVSIPDPGGRHEAPAMEFKDGNDLVPSRTNQGWPITSRQAMQTPE